MTSSAKNTPWHGALIDGATATLWTFDAGRTIGPVQTETLPDNTIIAGDSSYTSAVPCPVIPDALPSSGPQRVLSTVTQASPRDRLTWARVAAIGFQRLNPEWDGILCLPGHDTTYWLHLSAKEIVSFQGCATPQLARTLNAGTTADTEAAEQTMSRPANLAAQIHTSQVSQNANALLGHLLGAEIAATRPYWLGQEVALIGTTPITEAYATILNAQHVPLIHADGAKMVEKGFQILNAL
jgi:2-dehydro-3-deoxygalactonokinase